MNEHRKITLTLNPFEATMVKKVSEAEDLSYGAVARKAIRLYWMVFNRLSAGERLYFSDEAGKQTALELL